MRLLQVAWADRSHLVIYDLASADAVTLESEPYSQVKAVSIGGGWLTWDVHGNLTQTMIGAPIDVIRSAAGWN